MGARFPRWPALLACCALGFGCGGKREEFLGTRVEDACTSQWPVCAQIAGCLLGDQSYVTGRFPGSRLIGIQVFEPSTVTVSFQLEEIGAAGEETAINFFEDRCRARTRVTIAGKVLVDENERIGHINRSADISGVGDHLIDFTSDVHARYLMKVDVVPTRLKDVGSGP